MDGIICGDIAQLARAPALQAGGPGFESLCLHQDLSLTKYYQYEWDADPGEIQIPIWGELGASPDHSTNKQPCIVRIYAHLQCGRLAQLARAPRLHRGGRGFEPLSAHHEKRINFARSLILFSWLGVEGAQILRTRGRGHGVPVALHVHS